MEYDWVAGGTVTEPHRQESEVKGWTEGRGRLLSAKSSSGPELATLP